MRTIYEAPREARSVALRCLNCDHQGRYKIGTFVHGPSGRIGFTACVRCKQCDSPRDWDLSGDTEFKVMAYRLALMGGAEAPLVLGELATFDGFTYRFGGEAEDHLKGLIAQQPGRAFLLTRLGNLYRVSGDRRARSCYEAAVKADPADVEAWLSLGGVLEEAGRLIKAKACYREVLRHAGTSRLTLDMRRLVVRSALERLTELGEPDYAEVVTERDWNRLVDSFLPRVSQPGRNEQCPCGSGKKFKKCCAALAS